MAPAVADRSHTDSIRDRIAWRLCNLILHTIATPWYRRNMDALIRIGLARARVLKRQHDELEARRG